MLAQSLGEDLECSCVGGERDGGGWLERRAIASQLAQAGGGYQLEELRRPSGNDLLYEDAAFHLAPLRAGECSGS